MILQELKTLIVANQVKLIKLTGINSLYTIEIVTNVTALNTTLKTGRTGKEKLYSSVDRAILAMQNLGYYGEYSVKIIKE